MIYPLTIGPLAITGSLWYQVQPVRGMSPCTGHHSVSVFQGESDAFYPTPEPYSCMLKGMVTVSARTCLLGEASLPLNVFVFTGLAGGIWIQFLVCSGAACAVRECVCHQRCRCQPCCACRTPHLMRASYLPFSVAVSACSVLVQATVLDLQNTALASAIDLGDASSPYMNIHPRNKQTLGARLAANALVQVCLLVVWMCCCSCALLS